jgi:hypothetical protein
VPEPPARMIPLRFMFLDCEPTSDGILAWMAFLF